MIHVNNNTTIALHNIQRGELEFLKQKVNYYLKYYILQLTQYEDNGIISTYLDLLNEKYINLKDGNNVFELLKQSIHTYLRLRDTTNPYNINIVISKITNLNNIDFLTHLLDFLKNNNNEIFENHIMQLENELIAIKENL